MSLVSAHSYVGFNMALAFKLSHAVFKLGMDGLGGGGGRINTFPSDIFIISCLTNLFQSCIWLLQGHMLVCI